MSSNLRKRKASLSELPKTLSNPKPPMSQTGHVASNRQQPTIAPTVFKLLLVSLLLTLLPIFYYTQVMIPDPESSSSFLSQFRIQGNILLNAMGHVSSSDKHRIPYVHSKPSSPTPPSHLSSKKIESSAESAQDDEVEDTPLIRPKRSGLDSKVLIQDDPEVVVLQAQTGIRDEGRQIQDRRFRLTDDPTNLDSSITSQTQLSEEEEQRKLDEELGQFWEASSRYRSQAQRDQAGVYSIKGDGSSSSTQDTLTQQQQQQLASIQNLPPPDPDAQPGLTPEFWEAIKDQLHADDLTSILNDLRLKEQNLASHPPTNP